MILGDLDQKEKMAVFAGLILVGVVFLSAVYIYVNPPVQVWEAKVFDTYQTEKNTFILSYGEGKLKLPGEHDIEVGATYRITYQSRKRDVATIILSIEKLEG